MNWPRTGASASTPTRGRLAKLTPSCATAHGASLPANPKTYDFLDSSSPSCCRSSPARAQHFRCDETWDLGFGQTHDLIKKKAWGLPSISAIVRLADLPASTASVQFWGDIIRKYPNLILIPKDVTVLDWGYDHNENFYASPTSPRSAPSTACPGTRRGSRSSRASTKAAVATSTASPPRPAVGAQGLPQHRLGRRRPL